MRKNSPSSIRQLLRQYESGEGIGSRVGRAILDRQAGQDGAHRSGIPGNSDALQSALAPGFDVIPNRLYLAAGDLLVDSESILAAIETVIAVSEFGDMTRNPPSV
jgi:hypothetical protein